MIKTRQLTLAAAVLVAGQAYAAPELYGHLFLGALYEYKKETTTTPAIGNTPAKSKTEETKARPTMQSAGSRVGIKGDHKLNPTVDLEYQLEYNVLLHDVDKDRSTLFVPRNTYIGLKHKDYGSLRFGRLLTFDSDEIDTNKAWAYSDATVSPFSYEGQRANNTLAYYSPKLNNNKTQFVASYTMGESGRGGGSFDVFNNEVPAEAKREFAVIGATHEIDFAANRKATLGSTYTYAGKQFNALRGTVSYDIDDKLNLSGAVQRTDYNTKFNEFGVMLGASYEVDGLLSVSKPLNVYAQIGHSNNYKGYRASQLTVASVGATYDINDNLMAYSSISSLNKSEPTYKEDLKAFEHNKTKVGAFEVGLSYGF